MGLKISEVLVSTPAPDGTAAGVVRQEGEEMVWLTASIEGSRGGTGIDGYFGRVCGLEEHMVQGGLVPPGATRAIVVLPTGEPAPAAVGEGAYVIVYPGRARGPLPVRFEDPDGAIVRVPQPDSSLSEPVEGSDEPCAACGGTEWVRYAARSALVCRRCGHEEGLLSFYGHAYPGEPVDEARQAKVQREFDRSRRAALRDADFPVYVVAGRPHELSGWGGGELTIDQDGITVTTARERFGFLNGEQRSRDRLAHTAAPHGLPADMDEAALSLWIKTRKREAEQAVARAPAERRAIQVNGQAVEFVVVTYGDAWVAAADVDDELALTISGVGVSIEEIELVEMPSPEPA